MRLVQCWAWSEVRLMHRPNGRTTDPSPGVRARTMSGRTSHTRRAPTRQPLHVSPMVFRGRPGEDLAAVVGGVDEATDALVLLGERVVTAASDLGREAPARQALPYVFDVGAGLARAVERARQLLGAGDL